MVQLLDEIYCTLDCVLKCYDVYKVETIGDAYMVVSGLPKKTKFHAENIASMALHILSEAKCFDISKICNLKQRQLLKVRIGIHSGPVAAGVVGMSRPRYCLFGDSVNTASRMESTGEPLKIQISSACNIELQKHGGYLTEERGTISIKGNFLIIE